MGAAPHVLHLRSTSRLPGSHPKLPSLRQRQTRPTTICNHHRHRWQDEHSDRHDPEHRAGPGRLAGGHQDARNQRRRLLQHQQRASVREPHAALELLRDVLHLSHPRGPHRHPRPNDALPRARLGRLRRDGHTLLRRSLHCLLGRVAAQPAPALAGHAHRSACIAAAVRRQHGRQGGPLRHRQLRALRHSDDRRKLRRGEQHARLFHAPRRPRPHGQHHARRSHLRRRRCRHVRHACLRHPRSLHRRPHGRSHPRVSRQKDRVLRRQDGHALRAHLPALHPRSHRGLAHDAEPRTRWHHQSRPARPLTDSLRLHLGHRKQRVRLRRHQREHALVQLVTCHCDARWTLLDDHPDARCRRQSRTQEAHPAVARNLSRAHAAVHRTARWSHSHRRRAHLLPRAFARPNSGAPTPARRQDLLSRKNRNLLMSTSRKRSLWDAKIVRRALIDALAKLNPRKMMKNPVMFVVEIGSVITTIYLFRDLSAHKHALGFDLQITLWLWFTVLFANFAEAMAEGRGKAQADALRRAKSETTAVRYRADGRTEEVPSSQLRSGDLVLVIAGSLIPGDGEVVEGVASVDESAITGESAPVIREAGGDRSAVTGGTRVLSDQIKVKITSNPGETFLDRMIALVEGAERQKTPNEIALNILLAGLTIIFLLAVITLQPFAIYSGSPQNIFVLVSLLVCLIPTTIGGLLSSIGIAGMDRMIQRNVIAMSGRAVEASGDVDVLLLDKTGTITLGNRQASRFITAPHVTESDLASAAQLASFADETPEGRSIVVLAKEKYGLRGRELAPHNPAFIPFSAQTRMSGVDLDGHEIRKGAPAAIEKYVAERGQVVPPEIKEITREISNAGGTPLLVAQNRHVLGAVALTDVVKGGMRERFDHLRAMGIRTMMITGDNPLTAAAIARQAGVDDFLAEAKPEDKMALIKREQAKGKLVAMTGDGTNDAPALAQADVGVAMNTGTQAAKEAGNMVDLDSNPTKLIEIVEIGKQLLITRGALTTFSIANDVAKYFAMLPAMFSVAFPVLNKLNILRLHSPQSAITSAIIFNALIIVALIPLALRGVRYRPASAQSLLRRNLLIYGIDGLIIPFAGIKLIDLIIQFIPGFR